MRLVSVSWYGLSVQCRLVPSGKAVVEVCRSLIGLSDSLTRDRYTEANIRREQLVRGLMGFPGAQTRQSQQTP